MSYESPTNRLPVIRVVPLWIVLLGCGLFSELSGQEPHDRRRSASLAGAKLAVEIAADNVTASQWVRLGDAQLRAGKIKPAVASFEKAIQDRAELRPHLWQYGIALFFAQRYQTGRELFEAHRKVNAHDVENAAWHFLCAAKEDDVQAARKILLPAPNDPRPPMEQILARLRGGSDDAVHQAVNRATGKLDQESARFYADLYLGLIADAEGNADKAQRLLERAAGTKQTHYMADVARVYAERLSAQP